MNARSRRMTPIRRPISKSPRPAKARSGSTWSRCFPKKTWKNRQNGLRPDLAGMLAELRPAFVRFPGGCWVEGDTMKFAYRWKETIGDLSERRTQYNIWNYHATHGLGFHEYLQMCEDLGAEPLFVINCGMSHREVVPMDRMREFVQDALDAIEYCNGPADSPWGKLRADSGHPAPFHLKLMEIGNENGGPAYQERYALFYDAIKKRYPEMTLIANLPTDKRPADVVDEHYYSSPEFFIQQADRYDQYDRKGPKIYVGEYAVTQGCRPGQPPRRGGRGGIHGRHGTKLRRRGHGLLRPFVREREPSRLESRPDQLRRFPGLRHPLLSRPEDVQRAPRRRDRAG